MNSSSIDFAPGAGRAPVNGSIFAFVIPPGFPKFVIGQLFVASSMKPCQTYVVTSIEKTGLPGVETSELSLLPFQTPATRANCPAARPSVVGGAMKP